MKRNHKIKHLEELAEVLAFLRAQNARKKVVHCHGVFDLLHIGHIRHFEQAKTLGDILVVTVTSDKYVKKGPHRPVFSESLRAEAIAALDCVDYVAINKWPMALETIQVLQPDFYVKGSEYREAQRDRTGGITLEENAIKSVGGQLAFTDDITFSTSNIINRHLPIFSRELSEYLAGFSARYSADQIWQCLESVKSLRVLAIGETIIDEYQYCETMGKSGKEPVLATRLIYSERFAGGILAVANNVAAICDQVGLLTFLGRCDSQEDFIREKLDAKIDKMFLYVNNAPTIVKQRFIETYPFQKLFEVYVMSDGEGSRDESQALSAKLREVLVDYDVVIVTDYGHGMLGPETVEILCSQARFLAVNVQVNAGNYGLNTVSKYRRADYICISENEIRLEARSRRRDLREIVLEVAAKLSCERIVVTRGKQGSLCYGKGEGFFEVPAFAIRVVDRIGAGDAVFAVTAPCAAQRVPIEMIAFIGNAVGAQVVATVGTGTPIERLTLFRHIESLLK